MDASSVTHLHVTRVLYRHRLAFCSVVAVPHLQSNTGLPVKHYLVLTQKLGGSTSKHTSCLCSVASLSDFQLHIRSHTPSFDRLDREGVFRRVGSRTMEKAGTKRAVGVRGEVSDPSRDFWRKKRRKTPAESQLCACNVLWWGWWQEVFASFEWRAADCIRDY